MTIFLSTVAASYYIRTRGRGDVVIALYVFYLTISQVLAVKIVDFGTLGGLAISAPAAVLIFPFTFQLTDSMNEHFGQKETHRMILIAFLTQLLLVVFLWFSTQLAPDAFWNEISEPAGKQEYWEAFFSQSMRITAASLTSYLVTENLDAVIFARVRKKTGLHHLWVRNVISDVPTLALDSLIFVWLAFGGVNPASVVWSIVLGQVLTKWFFGLVDTPFVYLERFIVKSDKLPWTKVDLSTQPARPTTPAPAAAPEPGTAPPQDS